MPFVYKERKKKNKVLSVSLIITNMVQNLIMFYKLNEKIDVHIILFLGKRLGPYTYWEHLGFLSFHKLDSEKKKSM